MSTLAEILAWIRPAGPIAAIMLGFVGFGAWVDQNLREEARVAFGQFLASGKLATQIGWFPEGTKELFDRLFGSNHWTWKCLRRSVTFSLVTIGVFAALSAAHSEQARLDFHSIATDRSLAIAFGVWVFGSLVVDYLNLFKTRLILRWLSANGHRSIWAGIGVLAADLVIYDAVFSILCVIGFSVYAWLCCSGLRGSYVEAFFYIFSNPWEILFPNLDFFAHEFLVLFLAGLVPSIWIWVSVAAVAFTRLVKRTTALAGVTWSLLPFESSPTRCVGIVAGLLCSLSYVIVKWGESWVQ